jgi:general L-amino acid transport system permease protein
MNIQFLWRDIRFLKILAQAIFLIVLALVTGYLYFNVTTNLARQGLTVGYGFMNNPASFGIGESFIT